MKRLTELIGGTQLRALSWKEPYASLMLQGKVETRIWNTTYRGWVLMCASKVPYDKDTVRRIAGDDQMLRINQSFGFDDLYKGAGYCGHAFAVGYLADCNPMRPYNENACYVKYYPDLYCHVYERVHKIEPIPWRGSQGWRIVPANIVNTIVLL